MPRITYCVDCGVTLETLGGGPARKRCKDHALERQHAQKRAWYEKHPDVVKKKHQEWYVKQRKRNAKWRAENKRRAKAWRAKNREHIRRYDAEVRP